MSSQLRPAGKNVPLMNPAASKHQSDIHYHPSARHDAGDSIMDKRTFGRSGLKLSVLGFGCGAVGGLMVLGTAADQERAFARALDAGINYFDTASMYGDGESEKNLGRLIRQLKP